MKNLSKVHPTRSTLAVVLGAVFMLNACSDDGSDDFTVCGAGNRCPASHQQSLTLSEWAAEWVKWAMAQPADVNPMADKTGKHCAQGQPGADSALPPVWFLAGTSHGGEPTVRNCTVPEGRALFFPIVNVMHHACWANENCKGRDFEDSDVCPGQPKDEAEVKRIDSAFSLTDTLTEVTLVIDGKKVPDVATRQRAKTEIFTFTGPDSEDDVVIACTSKSRLAITDGVWAFITSLKAREEPYEIHFTADTNVGFSLDVTYNLTIAAPQE